MSYLAKAADNFIVACIVLDESRIVAMHPDGKGIDEALREEYERIELEMHELRAYTPRWLIGWERRIKDTTRSGHN